MSLGKFQFHIGNSVSSAWTTCAPQWNSFDHDSLFIVENLVIGSYQVAEIHRARFVHFCLPDSVCKMLSNFLDASRFHISDPSEIQIRSLFLVLYWKREAFGQVVQVASRSRSDVVGSVYTASGHSDISRNRSLGTCMESLPVAERWDFSADSSADSQLYASGLTPDTTVGAKVSDLHWIISPFVLQFGA